MRMSDLITVNCDTKWALHTGDRGGCSFRPWVAAWAIYSLLATDSTDPTMNEPTKVREEELRPHSSSAEIRQVGRDVASYPRVPIPRASELGAGEKTKTIISSWFELRSFDSVLLFFLLQKKKLIFTYSPCHGQIKYIDWETNANCYFKILGFPRSRRFPESIGSSVRTSMRIR